MASTKPKCTKHWGRAGVQAELYT